MAICESCIHNNVCKYGENRSNGMYCTGEKCRQYKSTADFVEVVRCKDCIFYQANCCFNRQWDLESSAEVPTVRDCDFCSYGEWIDT